MAKCTKSNLDGLFTYKIKSNQDQLDRNESTPCNNNTYIVLVVLVIITQLSSLILSFPFCFLFFGFLISVSPLFLVLKSSAVQQKGRQIVK